MSAAIRPQHRSGAAARRRSEQRLDVQGLRALAVVLVIVFHLTPKTLPGGYIGVDVFFVISGYLITAHLLREALGGGIHVFEFWARRVRRLLPAAFLVLVVSAAAVYLVLPSTARDQNFLEIAFAAVYGLNWRLAADSVDYLAADNSASIAQHYWSLSVEEQFYIVWPLLLVAALWLAARTRRVRPRHAMIMVLAVILAASLTFSIFETARSQPSAYFVTTTRAWEFATGGLIALIPATGSTRSGGSASHEKLRPRSRARLSWAGLALIIVPAFAFDASTPFPGWIAIIPVLGTALLLRIGDSDSTGSPQRLMHARPIQLAGDTSYAAYLWHWPLIVIATALLGRPPGWLWGSAIIAATFALAVATKHWVEDPVRKAPGFVRRRGATFGLMIVGMTAVAALTVTPVLAGAAQTQQRQETIAAELDDESGCFGAYALMNDCAEPYGRTFTVDPAATQADHAWRYLDAAEDCVSKSIAGRSQVACTTERGSGTGVMLVGDSHMYSLYPGFEELAKRRDWNLGLRARAGCAGLGIATTGSSQDRDQACAEWSEDMRKEIVADDTIDTVVFTAYEGGYEGIERQAIELFESLRDAGKQVIVLRDVPGTGSQEIKAPACVEASGDSYDPCTTADTQAGSWLSDAGEKVDADFVHPRELLCEGGSCHTVIGGTIVYHDSAHVSATFARTLTPWLDEQLTPLIANQDSR